MDSWRNERRPGYFGRRKDEIIAGLNSRWGEGNWRLVWVTNFGLVGSKDQWYTFAEACQLFYEESYYRYLLDRPADVDTICEYRECYDNAPTNVQSGLDYLKQEAFSTHIQDIAVRNALSRLGRSFTGSNGKLLQIRSTDSEGFRFGPGNVPFYRPSLITQPSMRPGWAGADSVEDFWQSNKWVQVKET